MRHFRTLFDITPDEYRSIEELAHRLKRRWKAGHRDNLLANQTLALLFEKPSLRTRVSFEAGMVQLGGTPLYMSKTLVGNSVNRLAISFKCLLSTAITLFVVPSIIQQSKNWRHLIVFLSSMVDRFFPSLPSHGRYYDDA